MYNDLEREGFPRGFITDKPGVQDFVTEVLRPDEVCKSEEGIEKGEHT